MSLQKFQKYIQRHNVNVSLLNESAFDPDIIVVIPCYDEPAILQTLTSLKRASVSDVAVEVIVVVNSGEVAPEFVIEQNRLTYAALQEESLLWNDNLKLSPVLVEGVRRKHAGVGYARKVGMDLAIARFYAADNTNGIIASLDADTRVASTYFEELQACFRNRPKCYGAIVKFEHDIKGESYSEEVYNAIVHYELHLRYVNQALKMSGFPYVCHTVGSAFAVRASAYVAHGGMNRRQGGEDFYFLHKLLPHGEFVELNSTAVYPSSRPSDRVPFGTGPQVSQFLQSQQLMTYSLDAFFVLKDFCQKVPLLFNANADIDFSPVMHDFLNAIGFEDKLEEIRLNSASEASFVKRFYAFFDAFKVVKFLNFSHQDYFSKGDIKVESSKLLRLLNAESNLSAFDLLFSYRKIEGR